MIDVGKPTNERDGLNVDMRAVIYCIVKSGPAEVVPAVSRRNQALIIGGPCKLRGLQVVIEVNLQIRSLNNLMVKCGYRQVRLKFPETEVFHTRGSEASYCLALSCNYRLMLVETFYRRAS